MLNEPDQLERPSLLAMIASRARRASDGGLAACAGAGIIALAVLAAVRPRWGAWLFPVIALGAYGAWGIADRELISRRALAPHSRATAALLVARWIAAALGTVAAVTAAIWIMLLALGTMVS
jgi:hypothetical protein